MTNYLYRGYVQALVITFGEVNLFLYGCIVEWPETKLMCTLHLVTSFVSKDAEIRHG